MSAKQLTYKPRASHLYLEHVNAARHEQTIDSCLAKIPSFRSREDKLLFAVMLSDILSIPTERCYQYAH